MFAFGSQKSSFTASQDGDLTGIFLGKDMEAEEHSFGLSSIRRLFGVKLNSNGRSIVATKNVNHLMICQKGTIEGKPASFLMISQDVPGLKALMSDKCIMDLTVERFSRESGLNRDIIKSGGLINAWGPGGIIILAIGASESEKLLKINALLMTGKVAVSSGNPEKSGAFIDEGLYLIDFSSISTKQVLLKPRTLADGRLARRIARLNKLAAEGVSLRDDAHLADRTTEISDYSNRFSGSVQLAKAS